MRGARNTTQLAGTAESPNASAAGDDWRSSGVAIRLALIGLVVLALGAIVYLLDRPAATVYLLPNALSLASGNATRFGSIGGYLPALAHVFGFILLTVAVIGSPARVAPICGFWWAVDSLIEIGQHAAIARHIAGALPDGFRRIPILDNTAAYFLRGTFDPWDLVWIALGTLLAYLSIRATCRKR